MREYAVSVICTLALTVIGGILCFKEDCKITKTAFSLILSTAIILPLAPLVKELMSSNTPSPDIPDKYYAEEYKEQARAALERGIAEAVSERFDIEKKHFSVKVEDFSFESMTCGRINVLLDIEAAFINVTEIKRYLENNFERCGVKVEFG